jgi:hypothetical protein
MTGGGAFPASVGAGAGAGLGVGAGTGLAAWPQATDTTSKTNNVKPIINFFIIQPPLYYFLFHYTTTIMRGKG